MEPDIAREVVRAGLHAGELQVALEALREVTDAEGDPEDRAALAGLSAIVEGRLDEAIGLVEWSGSADWGAGALGFALREVLREHDPRAWAYFQWLDAVFDDDRAEADAAREALGLDLDALRREFVERELAWFREGPGRDEPDAAEFIEAARAALAELDLPPEDRPVVSVPAVLPERDLPVDGTEGPERAMVMLLSLLLFLGLIAAVLARVL